MATTPPSPPSPDPPPLPTWLKSLPVAPEYHPTLAEFADPVSYLRKIEPEASLFGLCKIIPPIPSASKKSTVSNLNRSFSALDSPNPTPNKKYKNKKSSILKSPSFPTFSQQVGLRPAQKPVWPSGEQYSLQQFEAHAKQFERAYFSKLTKKSLSRFELETLFWKTIEGGKPLVVECATGIPGSGFPLTGGPGRRWLSDEVGNLTETEWNMRSVSRSKGSLLRFVREEINGVTSPVIDVCMMYSWFAWSIEDHELHGLDYLHIGEGKTWYGVPRDAQLAFEDAIRIHAYQEEFNPLVTFALLGEKKTLLSPEVLTGLGIPCCRLVQNPGEIVVTFPGAYHSGFSHGFNIGESVNIATPDWLRVAKEAAIRRACINYPPVVAHFQLLYSLALSLNTRGIQARRSRLKKRSKSNGESDLTVKRMFVQNVILNNHLLSVLLLNGSSCVVLPKSNTFCKSSIEKIGTKIKSRLADDDDESGDLDGFSLVKGNSASLQQNIEADRLMDQGLLLSCVTCGILSFSCMAIIRPKETAAKHLVSTDEIHDKTPRRDGSARVSNQSIEANSGVTYQISSARSNRTETSALDLLASAYGEDQSDCEDESDESKERTNNSSSGIESVEETAFSSSSVRSKSNPERNLNSNLNLNDRDSLRMHLFCLEHAMEVERKLKSNGGAEILLLCHPDYPKIEAEARELAEELDINYKWVDINYNNATEKDQEQIRAALEDEESVPVNTDWSVKLGVNLYYSANLSMSAPYRNQNLPYNEVIYGVFGCNNNNNSHNNDNNNQTARKNNKPVLAGKWCGKVWNLNQVHPYLCVKRQENYGEEFIERLYGKHCEERFEFESDGERKSGTKRKKKPIKKPSNKKPRIEETIKPKEEQGRVLRSSTRIKQTGKPNPNPDPNPDPNPKPEKPKPTLKTKGKKKVQATNKSKKTKSEYTCDIEGCEMGFANKKDLVLHKRDICPVKGCGKKFFSHKYLIHHRKVHMEDRPLKCPWEGCKMRFKWAWARTEHIRVHTGDRPYVCRERGCGQTFRFVSDFSRHKRNTGHSVKKGRSVKKE